MVGKGGSKVIIGVDLDVEGERWMRRGCRNGKGGCLTPKPVTRTCNCRLEGASVGGRSGVARDPIFVFGKGD